MIDNQILDRILPQQYPFRMIDRIEEFKKDEYLVAVKNITGNEWIYSNRQFHTDVFPETLIIEAAAQAALSFLNLSKEHLAKERGRFVLGKTKSEFYHSIYIGDQINFKTGAYKFAQNNGYIDISAFRADEKIADVTIFYSILH